jgi:hypothetical protein
MLEKVLLSFVCFILFILVHLVVFYLVDIQKHRFWILRGIWAFFAVVYTFLAWYIPGNMINEGIQETNALGWFISYLNGLLIYGFLFIFYGYPYYLADRSISIRTFVELRLAGQTGLTLPQLQKKYDHATLLSKRLEAMKYGGFVQQAGDIYRLTGKGRMAANFFAWFRKILHAPEGF